MDQNKVVLPQPLYNYIVDIEKDTVEREWKVRELRDHISDSLVDYALAETRVDNEQMRRTMFIWGQENYIGSPDFKASVERTMQAKRVMKDAREGIEAIVRYVPL